MFYLVVELGLFGAVVSAKLQLLVEFNLYDYYSSYLRAKNFIAERKCKTECLTGIVALIRASITGCDAWRLVTLGLSHT